MWKYLAIFALIFGLAVYIARQDERAAQKGAQNAAPPGNSAVPSEANEDHPQENVGDTKRHTPGWYSFFRWPNGTTTWAIILTLLAIAEQTSQTAKAAKATQDSVGHMERQVGIMEGQLIQAGKQTDAAEKAAEAAKASIKTLKEIERTWLVEKLPPQDHVPRRREHPFGGVWVIPVTITNIGKRPALIRMVQGRFHAPEDPLPDIPKYRQAGTALPAGRLLAPDEPMSWQCPLEEASLDDDQVNRINGDGRPLSLYIYGRIEYESAGLIGVNQFCYRWDNRMGLVLGGEKPGSRKDGPDGYNKHT
jgi:hypothetical protein